MIDTYGLIEALSGSVRDLSEDQAKQLENKLSNARFDINYCLRAISELTVAATNNGETGMDSECAVQVGNIVGLLSDFLIYCHEQEKACERHIKELEMPT